MQKITYNTTSVYYPYSIFTSRNEVPLHLISRLFPLSKTIKIRSQYSNWVAVSNCNLMIYTAMKRIIIAKSSIVITIGITLKSQKRILAGFWQPTNSELQLFQHLTNLLPLHIIYSKSVYAKLLISGNYILKILNDSKEVVFSRKLSCTKMATVQIQVKRARTVSNLETKHNLEFSIKSSTINFQNPLKMWKRYSSKNGKFNALLKHNASIHNWEWLNLQIHTETQFWAGNEYILKTKTLELRAIT
jgi:hypothetical protein